MKKFLYFLLLTMLLTTPPSFGNEDESICVLVGLVDYYYQNNYMQFWDILHQNEVAIEACTGNDETICFLQIAVEVGGNAEVGEYYHEILLSSIILKNPECFLKILSMLEQKIQKKILWDLSHMYSEVDKNSIKDSFSKFENNYEYRELFELLRLMKNKQAPFADEP